MKTALKVLVMLVLVVALLGLGGFVWAKNRNARLLGRTIEVHEVDFPIPFPLDSAEIAELGLAPEEADSLALERARERGRHLMESRYGCTGCHGEDLAGGVMIDAPPIGEILGSNLTTGAGSRTLDYRPADWDRIVRHGVKPDGSPTAMPSIDFKEMSDQELSDLVAYIRSRPPVDATVPPVTLGPVGTMLLATGQIRLSADVIGDHLADHLVRPPEEGVSAEFGRHLAAVCAGCHGEDFAGGPIVGGDPSWPPAANLTPHEEGLADWTFERFATSMREGRRPDGTQVGLPMIDVLPMTARMSDTELEAIWTYLRSVPPAPTRR